MEQILKNLNRYLDEESGVSAVEFSIVGSIFLLFIFGTIEAGRIMWTYNTMEYAVENAVRYAIVHQEATNGEILDVASNSFDDMFVSPDGFTATVDVSMQSGMDFIQINATYDYEAVVTAFLPASVNNFQLSTEVRHPLIWTE